MAKSIYKIQLKEDLFPAVSAAEALEIQNNGNSFGVLQEDEVVVTPIVGEESTIKLFMLAKTMYDMEKYTYQEIKSTLTALACQMGYWKDSEQIAETVTTWVERFDELPADEFQEWLLK